VKRSSLDGVAIVGMVWDERERNENVNTIKNKSNIKIKQIKETTNE
jgi:hypothetical protein